MTFLFFFFFFLGLGSDEEERSERSSLGLRAVFFLWIFGSFSVFLEESSLMMEFLDVEKFLERCVRMDLMMGLGRG